MKLIQTAVSVPSYELCLSGAPPSQTPDWWIPAILLVQSIFFMNPRGPLESGKHPTSPVFIYAFIHLFKNKRSEVRVVCSCGWCFLSASNASRDDFFTQLDDFYSLFANSTHNTHFEVDVEQLAFCYPTVMSGAFFTLAPQSWMFSWMFCFFQMWTSALRVRATAAASPPATTRWARTSANAKTATGGWATTANVRIENNNNNKKALAPRCSLLQRGNGGLTFFGFLCLCFSQRKKAGKPKRGRKRRLRWNSFLCNGRQSFLKSPCSLITCSQTEPWLPFFDIGPFQ